MKFKGPKLLLVNRLQMMARRSKILFKESGDPLSTPLRSFVILQNTARGNSAHISYDFGGNPGYFTSQLI